VREKGSEKKLLETKNAEKEKGFWALASAARRSEATKGSIKRASPRGPYCPSGMMQG
jgi:hypothetical protein